VRGDVQLSGGATTPRAVECLRWVQKDVCFSPRLERPSTSLCEIALTPKNPPARTAVSDCPTPTHCKVHLKSSKRCSDKRRETMASDLIADKKRIEDGKDNDVPIKKAEQQSASPSNAGPSTVAVSPQPPVPIGCPTVRGMSVFDEAPRSKLGPSLKRALPAPISPTKIVRYNAKRHNYQIKENFGVQSFPKSEEWVRIASGNAPV
jgi:hypothetical protein